MTKVFLNPFLLQYQQDIVDLANECIKKKHIDGVKSMDSGEPVLAQANLLPPPRIEYIDLLDYDGKLHDLILLLVSDDFGLGNVHVSIKDDKGTVIESGDAFACRDNPDIWNYFTSVPVPSGTSLTVYVMATDHLGGVGTLSEDTTIP
jgi:hypothetical protein